MRVHVRPEQWERTAEHGEYGTYSMFMMFRHLALHDILHAYRIEEILLKKDWAYCLPSVDAAQHGEGTGDSRSTIP